MNGFSKPCNTAPESLDDEYNKMTAAVADSFREIDKYLILSAVNELPEGEQTFISSSDAIMYPVKLSMRSNRRMWSAYGVPFNNDISIFLNKTDLVSVCNRGQERIYALKGEKSNKEGYEFIRVDRDIRKYIDSGILDYDFGSKYVVNDSTITSVGDTFSHSIHTDKQKVSDGSDNINSLTDWLSRRHRDDLFRNLYEVGNDKSDIQKIWRVVKHIIPFYDCVEGIVNNDPVQAVPACLMDAVAFIPVFGQAGSLSAKFGMGLTRGLRSGAVIVGKAGIKVAGKNALREVSLPTTAELALLGKNSLRAIDPGFELATGMVTSISRNFNNKIMALLYTDKKTASLAKSMTSAGVLDRFPQAPSGRPIMATLPRAKVDVPVTAAGKRGGREIYVRVNPETGEKFGERFFLDEKGNLLKVKQTYGKNGGVNVGKSIPPDLQGDIAEFQRYIKELQTGSCVASVARQKRQVNCRPLSLSTQALNRVLEYATVDELSVLARNPAFRDSVFRAVNDAARVYPETADRLIKSIAEAAVKSGDSNLLATIAIGRIDTDIYRALNRYQQQLGKTVGIEMGIESPRVLGTHEFAGYNPNPNIPSQTIHASYTAIDTDNFVRRLNIVAHGIPGGVFLNGGTMLNADELYHTLLENGVFDDNFTEIRMLVCHSADNTQNGGVSVAERLSQLTGTPVEGYHGIMTMYESFNVGSISIPSIPMVNDAYVRGGAPGATEFMHNNRDYISIGPHPHPSEPNNPETFYL